MSYSHWIIYIHHLQYSFTRTLHWLAWMLVDMWIEIPAQTYEHELNLWIWTWMESRSDYSFGRLSRWPKASNSILIFEISKTSNKNIFEVLKAIDNDIKSSLIHAHFDPASTLELSFLNTHMDWHGWQKEAIHAKLY